MRPVHRPLLVLPALALPLALGLFLQVSRADPLGGPPAPVVVRRLPAPAVVPSVEARRAPVLPLASIHAAVETTDGWVVLDATTSRLLWLDGSGAPVRSAGREGQGPGEMGSPAALAAVDAGVLVLETLGGPAHLFDGDGRFVERRAPPRGACPSGPIVGASGRGGAVFVLRTCPAPDGTLRAHVERWDANGATRPVHQDVIEHLGETLSPFRVASVAALPSGVAYGLAFDGCALVLTADGSRRTVCPAPEGRPPFPAAAAARARAVLGGRARAAGVRLVVPERAPLFEGVASAGGRLGFLVRPSAGALAMDVVGDDGRVVRVTVAGTDRLFAGVRSLLAVRETLEGPVVTVVPLP